MTNYLDMLPDDVIDMIYKEVHKANMSEVVDDINDCDYIEWRMKENIDVFIHNNIKKGAPRTDYVRDLIGKDMWDDFYVNYEDDWDMFEEEFPELFES